MHLPPLPVLIEGLRPKTLSLSLMPVMVALFWALSNGDAINLMACFLIFISALSIQITTNLHNDVRDFLNGTDHAGRIGPRRITQAGLATPKQTRNAAFLFAMTAVMSGIYLGIIGGWPIILIGMTSIICAFGYSSGPYPISRSPFGEFFVLIFFGLLATGGSYYLITGHWAFEAFYFGVIVGLPACAVLLLNNLRDLENDQASGRCTLAILLGHKKSKNFYVGLMILPYVLLFYQLIPVFSFVGLFICLFTIWQTLNIRSNHELNRCLGLSALSQVFLGFGICIDLLI